jgi:nucleoside-diphosphate-sugar epimerase
MNAAKEGCFSATVLRPSNIYGEDMPNQSLRCWIRMVKWGLFFFIGQPRAMTNYVHVDDVVRALHLCAQDKRAAGRIYNLSAGCTIEEFVQTMCRILGRGIPGMRIPENTARLLAKLGGGLPGFPLKPSRIDALTGRASYSSKRILSELNFKPAVDAKEGLSRMIQAMTGETDRHE